MRTDRDRGRPEIPHVADRGTAERLDGREGLAVVAAPTVEAALAVGTDAGCAAPASDGGAEFTGGGFA